MVNMVVGVSRFEDGGIVVVNMVVGVSRFEDGGITCGIVVVGGGVGV